MIAFVSGKKLMRKGGKSMIHRCKCGGRLLRSDRMLVPVKGSRTGYFLIDLDQEIAHFECDRCRKKYQQKKRLFVAANI
jgi:hypothetical protein